MGETEEKRRINYKRFHRLRNPLEIARADFRTCLKEHPRFAFLQFIRWKLYKLIGVKFFVKRIEKKVKETAKKTKKGGYIGLLVWSASPETHSYLAESFKNYTMLQFEDELFSAPLLWDEVLSRSYGNYMELPPEDKRNGHNMEAYYLKK